MKTVSIIALSFVLGTSLTLGQTKPGKQKETSLPLVKKISETGDFIPQKKALNAGLDSIYADNARFNKSIERLDKQIISFNKFVDKVDSIFSANPYMDTKKSNAYIDTINKMMKQTEAEIDLKNRITKESEEQTAAFNLLAEGVRNIYKNRADSLIKAYAEQKARLAYYNSKGKEEYVDSANQMIMIINATAKANNGVVEEYEKFKSFNNALADLQTKASDEFNKAAVRSNTSFEMFNKAVTKANNMTRTLGARKAINQDLTPVNTKMPEKKK